jgi:hypothetical protein
MKKHPLGCPLRSNLIQRRHNPPLRPGRRILLYIISLRRLVERLVEDRYESFGFLDALCGHKLAEFLQRLLDRRAGAEIVDALLVRCAEGLFC